MISKPIPVPTKTQILASIPGLLGYLYFSFIHQHTVADTHFYFSIGIALLVVNLWIAEPIPVWMSSLLPFIALQAHGVLDIKTTLSAYFNTTILLFLGGFLLAYSVEKWHLHKRIAFKLLALTGDNPRGIVWGMMLTLSLIHI